MSFNLKRGAGDLNRLREILVVVFEAGGGILIDRVRLRYLVPLSCRIRCLFRRRSPETCLVHMRGGTPVASPEVLREVLEKLGPTFVKLGQVLSLRADLVGEDISNELTKLQSDVGPIPYREVAAVIAEELHGAPEEIFKSVEEKPVAAASLAQVHRAFLKDGTEVALKVQRPNIRRVIEQDIHILFYLAHLAERFVPELRPFQPLRVVKEFADWTMRELDFAAEGRNADRFRAAFRENPHVHIPKIYWEHTTPRVLTMEFLHGVKADDLEGMRRLGIHAQELARYGVEALLQQFLIDGFFHADPHPGNFFAMPGDVLCLHDFGMVGYLTQEQRAELASCFVAFVDKDTDNFLKHFTHLAIVSEGSDVGAFHRDVSTILSEFFYAPNQPSIARAFFRIINKGAGHGIAFPADLALFGKAIITTETMGLKLYPKFNFNEELRPFVGKAFAYYLDPRRSLQSLKTGIFDYMEFLKTLPERTQGLLSKIEKGELSVKVDPAELLEFKKEFDRQNDLRILGIMTAVTFFATAALLYAEGRRTIEGIPLSSIGVTAVVVLAAWMIVKIRRSPR